MSTPESGSPEALRINKDQPSGLPASWHRGLWVGSVTAVVVLGIVIYSGIHSRARAETNLGETTERAAIPSVNVVQPIVGSVLDEIVLPGNTSAFSDTPIYARTNGYLKRWYFDIGAHVRQGQLLAEIDTPELDHQLEQARADLKNAVANEEIAEITAARWQNLLKTSSVSQQETDQAVSDLSARKASVDSMKANVHRLEELQSFERVYAPFSGIITARNTDLGALINAGAGGAPQELFHMAAVDRLRVYVAVPEVDSQFAETGAKATLTLDEFPGEVFEGTIVRDAHSIDLASRTLNVEIDINNKSERIKNGSYVFVHFKRPHPKTVSSTLLTLPANTLLFRSEGLRVAVVRNGHAELVPIKIGRDFGATVEIVAGLHPTDYVIVNPSDSLASGREVEPRMSHGGGSK